jgi:hypothetical protein
MSRKEEKKSENIKKKLELHTIQSLHCKTMKLFTCSILGDLLFTSVIVMFT